MRRLLCAAGLAIVLGVLCAPGALAQTDDVSIGESGDALPGVARLGLPRVGRTRVSSALTAGLSYTEATPTTSAATALGGTLAVSGAFSPWAAVSASMTLRNGSFGASDAHDADLVSSSRLALRLGYAGSASHQIGLELAGLLPSGTEAAPAIDGLSAEARLLAAFGVTSPTVWLASLGVRVDQSAKALDAGASTLPADRVLIDSGSREALLLGLGLSHRIASFELLGELGADVWMDTSADELAQSPVRLDLGARYHASRLVQLELMLEGTARALPTLAVGEPVERVAPRMSAMLGVRVGLPAGRARTAERETEAEAAPEPRADAKRVSEAETTAAVEPTAETKTAAQTAAVAETAAEPETATPTEVSPAVEGESEAAPTPTAAPGEGTIQGNIRAFDGSPLQATVTVYPLKLKTTAHADGTFEINLKPGRYTVRLRAFGYRSQNRTVIVQENGVTVLNAELRKK